MSDDLPVRSGMLLQRVCWSLVELRQWLSTLLTMEILRCVSPERDRSCDRAATVVFWVDAAEWYPCCEEHRVSGDQWVGTTRFVPHVVSVAVLDDRAQQWLDSLPSEERARIQVVAYIREG